MNAAEATITWGVVGVLIALMVLWSTVLLLAIKWMIGASEKHVERRVVAVEASIDRAAVSQAALSRQLQEHRVGFPKEYVRREDWIRFSTMILASVDRVGSRLDEEMAGLRQMLEAMPKAERKTDA